MMVETENKFEYLQDLIGKTRRSRIEAERRLLKLNSLSNHACIYYACITTLLSLSTLFFDCKGLSFLSVSSAIVVMACTVYASAQNYGVRAEQMKGCYLDLQKLHLSLDDKRVLQDSEAEELANNIGEHYVDIIRQTENHLPRDYRIAHGEEDTLLEQLRWLALRLAVYVMPVVVAALLSLAVWPL